MIDCKLFNVQWQAFPVLLYINLGEEQVHNAIGETCYIGNEFSLSHRPTVDLSWKVAVMVLTYKARDIEFNIPIVTGLGYVLMQLT